VVISVAFNLIFVSSLFLPQHLFNLSKRKFQTSQREKAKKFLNLTNRKDRNINGIIFIKMSIKIGLKTEDFTPKKLNEKNMAF
jgi:hypothetical protein